MGSDEKEKSPLFSMLFEIAELLPHKVNAEEGKIEFLHMTEDAYRDSSFLDGRAHVKMSYSIPINSILKSFRNGNPWEYQPVHQLLYNGYCGSTLLSRYLYDLPGCHVTREPVITYWLSQVKTEDPENNNPEIQEISKVIYYFLTRRWRKEEAIFIKIPSVCSVIADNILDMNSNNSAVILYADKREFLIGYLKRENRRDEAMRMYAIMLKYSRQANLLDNDLPNRDSDQMNVARYTAGLWIMYQALYLRLLEKYSSSRIQCFSSQDFYDDPCAVLSVACKNAGLNITEYEAMKVITGPVAGSYSKAPGVHYSSKQRISERGYNLLKYRDEVSDGLGFINKYAGGLDRSL